MPNYSLRLDDLPNRIRPVMLVDDHKRILGKGDIAFALSLLALEGFQDDLDWHSLELANKRLKLEWRSGFDWECFEEWWQELTLPPKPADRAYISFAGYQFSLEDRLFSDEAIASAIDTYYYRTALLSGYATESEANIVSRNMLWVLCENLIFRCKVRNNPKAC